MEDELIGTLDEERYRALRDAAYDKLAKHLAIGFHNEHEDVLSNEEGRSDRVMAAVQRIALEAALDAAGADEGLLQLLAGAVAYYELASRRAVDSIAMHVRHFLLVACVRELEALPSRLLSGGSGSASNGITGEGAAPDLAQLMVEDSSVAQRRAELLGRRTRLMLARRELSSP